MTTEAQPDKNHPAEWWESQRNLGSVAHYMAHVRGDTATTIAEVMEKPWKWPELWAEFQACMDVDIDEMHIRQTDGKCVISLNGQGHLPCPVTMEQVQAALETDILAKGYMLTGALRLAHEQADRVAHTAHAEAVR